MALCPTAGFVYTDALLGAVGGRVLEEYVMALFVHVNWVGFT